MSTSLENYLAKFSEPEWLSALDGLAPAIHPVDRNATQVWFRFFPLEFRRFVENQPDEAEVRRSLGLLGDYDLAEQIDTSHRFLYGHRYWKTVKEEIENEAGAFNNESRPLADEIRQVAARAAERVKTDSSLVLGITAVGLMTLDQVGLDKFKAASGEVRKPGGLMAKSPDQIVAERERDDSQGLLGFLRTVDKKFS